MNFLCLDLLLMIEYIVSHILVLTNQRTKGIESKKLKITSEIFIKEDSNIGFIEGLKDLPQLPVY